MKDACSTVNKILEEPIRVKELKRIRDLVRTNNISGIVKSGNAPGELTGKYTIWFRTLSETAGLNDAIKEGKTVRVTIKEIGGRWSVIKDGIAIITPNTEIPEPTLEEQTKEYEALGNDY
jgi:hypothetical protein